MAWVSRKAASALARIVCVASLLIGAPGPHFYQAFAQGRENGAARPATVKTGLPVSITLPVTQDPMYSSVVSMQLGFSAAIPGGFQGEISLPISNVVQEQNGAWQAVVNPFPISSSPDLANDAEKIASGRVTQTSIPDPETIQNRFFGVVSGGSRLAAAVARVPVIVMQGLAALPVGHMKIDFRADEDALTKRFVSDKVSPRPSSLRVPRRSSLKFALSSDPGFHEKRLREFIAEMFPEGALINIAALRRRAQLSDGVFMPILQRLTTAGVIVLRSGQGYFRGPAYVLDGALLALIASRLKPGDQVSVNFLSQIQGDLEKSTGLSIDRKAMDAMIDRLAAAGHFAVFAGRRVIYCELGDPGDSNVDESVLDAIDEARAGLFFWTQASQKDRLNAKAHFEEALKFVDGWEEIHKRDHPLRRQIEALLSNTALDLRRGNGKNFGLPKSGAWTVAVGFIAWLRWRAGDTPDNADSHGLSPFKKMYWRFILFNLFSLADLALTSYFLRNSDEQLEINYLARACFTAGGLIGLAVYKISTMVAFNAAVWVISLHKPKWGGRVLFFGIVAVGAVVIYTLGGVYR